MLNKTTIDQWRVFATIIETGSFSNASKLLFKSQPALSSTIKNLESITGKKLFTLEGRRAVPSPFALQLLPLAKTFLAEANLLEQTACQPSEQANKTLALAIDTLYPPERLAQAIDIFTQRHPYTNLKIYETTLSLAKEMLEDNRVSAIISSLALASHTSAPIATISKHLVAAHSHPLAQMDNVELQDLSNYCQVILTDLGSRTNLSTGLLPGRHKIATSNVSSSANLVRQGVGFAWLPEAVIDDKTMARVQLDGYATREVLLQYTYHPSHKEIELLVELKELLQ
ncbi:hypothetical protein BIT28_06465 [Photobacterium proteolyticum]|uniref:HTH lysR-type domain-containing protein n=1 Tax=Photobacterium proteolyticum TaxID=1903952 RepID=A0A1Q9GEJ0_9GAMM|nr:LysR family transcriptional regulator [Photobacterium proteolyticum]OLQ72825.1 hypothetical protein BIT28_06465 [Photobacterium proteolyticum]